MTKSSYDSVVSPGPPLPASHPSPALLAKLHLEAASLCASAESLMRIPASRKNDMEVTESLLLYARDTAALHGALARKWLGAEKGNQDAHGMAVGFLGWAKRELDALRDSSTRKGGKEKGRDERRDRRGYIVAEAEDVSQFLRYHTRLNDTVRFLLVCGVSRFMVADCPVLSSLSCRFSRCRRRLNCRRVYQPVASRSLPRHLCRPPLRLALTRLSSSASMRAPSTLLTRNPLLMANGIRQVLPSERPTLAQALISKWENCASRRSIDRWTLSLQVYSRTCCRYRGYRKH